METFINFAISFLSEQAKLPAAISKLNKKNTIVMRPDLVGTTKKGRRRCSKENNWIHV